VKIAAISDIHGNLAALDAVLTDIRLRGVNAIVNLGDILSGALYPCETADRLMPLNMPAIRGNHERQVLTLEQNQMRLSDRYAALTLRPDQKNWIASLPATLWFSDDVLLVHGTPDSDLAYFLETVDESGLRPATAAEIEERAGSASAKVILCGHTHVPRAVRLADGRLIVNPGSVGLPAYADDHPHPHAVETGSPHARYAIIEKEKDYWSAQLLAIDYEWEAAAITADQRGRADWGRALRTGKV